MPASRMVGEPTGAPYLLLSLPVGILSFVVMITGLTLIALRCARSSSR